MKCYSKKQYHLFTLLLLLLMLVRKMEMKTRDNHPLRPPSWKPKTAPQWRPHRRRWQWPRQMHSGNFRKKRQESLSLTCRKPRILRSRKRRRWRPQRRRRTRHGHRAWYQHTQRSVLWTWKPLESNSKLNFLITTWIKRFPASLTSGISIGRKPLSLEKKKKTLRGA